MTELRPDDSADDLIAQVRREFAEGLPARLEVLRSALSTLGSAYDPAAAERFYQRAHGLKGTAASFEADELVEPATRLARLGRGFWQDRSAPPDALAEARDVLLLLERAIHVYRARVEGRA